MKKLTVLLGLVMLTSIALAEPIWVRDGSGISGTLRDVSMLSDSTGWAVGDAGVIYKRSGKLYPTSAEQVWFSMQIPALDPEVNWDFKGVCFTDEQNGWIVGYRNCDESITRKNKYKGVILRTTNGGSTWTASYPFLGTPDSLTPFLKVKMTYSGGAYNGYISCGNGYILKWTPGTNQWLKLRPSTGTSDTLTIWYNSLWMDKSNPNYLWATGDQSCMFMQSGDGGASWSAIQNTGFNQNYNFPSNTNLEYQTQVAPLGMDVNGSFLYTGMGEGLAGQYNGSWSLLPSLGRDNWNYDLAIGIDSVLLTCGNTNRNIGAIRRIKNGEIAYEKAASGIYTLSLKSLDFPPNSDQARAAGNTILHRYEPAEIINFHVDRQGDSLYASWTTTKENNIRKWNICYHGVIAQDAGMATSDSLLPNGADSAYTIGFHSWHIGSAAGDSSRDIYITIRATCQDGTILNFGPIRATEGIYKKMPDPVTITKVEDVPGDNGHQLKIEWHPATWGNFTTILRSLAPTGPWLSVGGGGGSLCSTFVDGNVPLNDVSYYYNVQSMSDGVSYSQPSNIVSGIAKDSIAPVPLAPPTAYYNASDSVMTLNWNNSAATDFGGYWVCPEPVGAFASKPSTKYTVNHAAPIERTTWSYRVPDYLIGQTLQMHVTAMDRSGNIGPWSDFVQLNTKAFTNSNTAMATAFNNGRHLLYDNNGKLHLTYTSVDSVFYQNSTDNGYTWAVPAAWLTNGGFAAGGTNPSSVVGVYGSDTTITWKAETPLVGWVLKSAKRDNSSSTKWSDPKTILEQSGGYEQGHVASPPAMVINSAGTHLTVERIDSYTIPGGQTGYWHWKVLYGYKATGQDAYAWTILDSAQGTWGGGPIDNPASPTICIDPKGGIHVAWDFDGEVYWKMYDPFANAWKSKINLSNSPNVVSEEPSLSFYGDVHIVWQEGNDIYHNKGNWGLQPASKLVDRPFSWQGSENVSNNSGTASLSPVFDGNYIAWSEQSATKLEQYNACFASYNGFQWNIESDYSKNPTQPSVYPQIAYHQGSDGNQMAVVWTEGTGPLYSLIARDSTGVAASAQFAADVGGTEPSIYTIQRDGYLTYTQNKSSTITVDYDSTALQYYLPYLDKDKKQEIMMAFYQENGKKAKYQYKIYIDNVPLGVVNVPSGQTVLFEKSVPNSVTHDGEGILKIENKKGAIATCDWWELYAYDKATGKGGGSQSEMGEAKPVTYRYELMQNAPNPCSKNTMINYQLAKQGQVSLKVYNTLGQVVKTLVNENQNPGPYSVKWNGRDESGRQAAAGIYFYRLASGEFNSIKKMVVLR